jgi:predicted membrane protein
MLSWDALFCPYCGRNFASSNVAGMQKRVTTGLRILLYVISILVPIAGIVIGIVFIIRDSPDEKHVGTLCLIFGVVSMVIMPIILSAILYWLVLGYGMVSYWTPCARLPMFAF